MQTVLVRELAQIRAGLDALKGVRVVGMEPFSRMPLSRFGVLDGFNLMDEACTFVVTFDLCQLLTETLGLQPKREVAGSSSNADADDIMDPQTILEQLSTVEGRQLISSNTQLRELLQYLENKAVSKVMYDGRALADALLHQLGVRLSLVIDVRLLPMFCGFQETNSARRHRGVLRLPNFEALLTFLDPPPPTHLHALLGIHQKVKETMTQGTHSFLETAVASGRYLDSVRTVEKLTAACFHPYLPFGVVSTAKEDWVPCTECGRPAPRHFISSLNGACNVCNELRQPCLKFRRGYCNNPACEYVHEHIPCHFGKNCIDRHLGFCGFTHEDDEVFLTRQVPPVVSSGDGDGAATLVRAKSPFRLNPRLSSPNVHTIVASVLANRGAKIPTGTAGEGATPAEAKNEPRAEANSALNLKDTPATGRPRGRVHAPPDQSARVGWTAPTASTPFLLPNAVRPCHYFFGPLGCARGNQCRFSHDPVPLFVPIPVVCTETSTLRRSNAVPCPNELRGRICRDVGCAYLHLPSDTPLPRKYAIDPYSGTLRPRSLSRAPSAPTRRANSSAHGRARSAGTRQPLRAAAGRADGASGSRKATQSESNRQTKRAVTTTGATGEARRNARGVRGNGAAGDAVAVKRTMMRPAITTSNGGTVGVAAGDRVPNGGPVHN